MSIIVELSTLPNSNMFFHGFYSLIRLREVFIHILHKSQYAIIIHDVITTMKPSIKKLRSGGLNLEFLKSLINIRI